MHPLRVVAVVGCLVALNCADDENTPAPDSPDTPDGGSGGSGGSGDSGDSGDPGGSGSTPDPPDDPPTATYVIGGTVEGLAGEVVLSNGFDVITLLSDGPFTFSTALADGSVYDVRPLVQPDGQICSVASGKGVVQGEDFSGVEVACLSSRVDLEDLTISVGTLEPAFDAEVLTYATEVGYWANSLQVTATAVEPDAVLSVNGVELVSGEPSALVELDFGLNTVSVVVTSPEGTARTYSLVVYRRTSARLDYLKGSVVEPDDQFGASVGADEDTLVVGAPIQDEPLATGANEGAVFVFSLSGGQVVERVRLTSPEATDYEHFGEAVAISGDTIVAGSPGREQEDVIDFGSAFVFRNDAGEWLAEAELRPAELVAGDRFGEPVAIDGDTIAVGAIGDDTRSGAVYVFHRNDGVWDSGTKLKASNFADGDKFGWQVSLSGSTLVVGAPAEDSDATGANQDEANDLALDSGAAYVFQRSDAGWNQVAYLKASNTDAADQFGYSVAVSGGLIAVGAPTEDSHGHGVYSADQGNDPNPVQVDFGAVYVFRSSGGAWIQEAYIKSSNTNSGDLFGGAVSLDGLTLAVGAIAEDSSGAGINPTNDYNQGGSLTFDCGAAYTFSRSVAGVWSQSAYLKPSNPGLGYWFGTSVSIRGGLLVVGANGEDATSTGINGSGEPVANANTGAAYVYH